MQTWLPAAIYTNNKAMSGRPPSKIDSAILSHTSKPSPNELEKGKPTQRPPRDADLNDAHANAHAAMDVAGLPAKNSFEDRTRASKTRKALSEKAKRTMQLEHHANHAPFHDELRKEHRENTKFQNETRKARDHARTRQLEHHANDVSFHDEMPEARDREEFARDHESHHRGQKIWCGNDILDPRLTRNGAANGLRIGRPSECFRRGVGSGIHQKLEPDKAHDFLKTWIAPYKKRIEQPMHYGDGPVPEGKIRATLGQCLSRGFAVGSIQKAKKTLKHQHEAGRHP